MNDMNICTKYLKENDELLFEVYATGKINKVGIISNIIGSFLAGGTFEVKDNYYILGVGKHNIYILNLGKHYDLVQIPKDITPKEVKVLELNSIKDVNTKPLLFGSLYKLKLIDPNDNHVYYLGKSFINEEQLKYLKSITA